MSKTDLKTRADARKALLSQTNTGEDVLAKRAEARRAFLGEVTEEPVVTDQSLENRASARRAYMQGGLGPNDPKELGFPGELKYPRMDVPVDGDSRQWEQNWFEGAAKVTKEKMGPSGVELELKKKMQRASDELRGLQTQSQEDPAKAKLAAKKIANDLNAIVIDLDKAGYIKEAEEADSVLEEIASYIAAPVQPVVANKQLELKNELVKIADLLDSKGYTKEASELDEILSEI